MSRPVLLYGAGGHGSVLLDALGLLGGLAVGFIDDNPSRHGQTFVGLPILGLDEALETYPPDKVDLINAIGSTRAVTARRDRFLAMQQLGYRFARVIHPAAIVAASASLGQGTQVMAGAVVQAGARLGDNTLINTRAVIDHDCNIDDHAHIAPGVTLSGNVAIGQATHIGVGASVVQGVCIGAHVTVGAGAVVLHDVPDHATVVGVPARPCHRK